MDKFFQFADLVGADRSAVQSRVRKVCEEKRIAVTRENILAQLRDLKVAEFVRQDVTKKLNL